jgi:hypothetical protein
MAWLSFIWLAERPVRAQQMPDCSRRHTAHFYRREAA